MLKASLNYRGESERRESEALVKSICAGKSPFLNNTIVADCVRFACESLISCKALFKNIFIAIDAYSSHCAPVFKCLFVIQEICACRNFEYKRVLENYLIDLETIHILDFEGKNINNVVPMILKMSISLYRFAKFGVDLDEEVLAEAQRIVSKGTHYGRQYDSQHVTVTTVKKTVSLEAGNQRTGTISLQPKNNDVFLFLDNAQVQIFTTPGNYDDQKLDSQNGIPLNHFNPYPPNRPRSASLTGIPTSSDVFLNNIGFRPLYANSNDVNAPQNDAKTSGGIDIFLKDNIDKLQINTETHSSPNSKRDPFLNSVFGYMRGKSPFKNVEQGEFVQYSPPKERLNGSVPVQQYHNSNTGGNTNSNLSLAQQYFGVSSHKQGQTLHNLQSGNFDKGRTIFPNIREENIESRPRRQRFKKSESFVLLHNGFLSDNSPRKIGSERYNRSVKNGVFGYTHHGRGNKGQSSLPFSIPTSPLSDSPKVRNMHRSRRRKQSSPNYHSHSGGFNELNINLDSILPGKFWVPGSQKNSFDNNSTNSHMQRQNELNNTITAAGIPPVTSKNNMSGGLTIFEDANKYDLTDTDKQRVTSRTENYSMVFSSQGNKKDITNVNDFYDSPLSKDKDTPKNGSNLGEKTPVPSDMYFLPSDDPKNDAFDPFNDFVGYNPFDDIVVSISANKSQLTTYVNVKE